MNLLQHYQNQPPTNEFFLPRKREIPKIDRVNIYGVRGSGKSSLVLDYILEYDIEKILYIDCLDPNLRFTELKPTIISQFCKEQDISLLILDHYDDSIKLDIDIKEIIVISRVNLELVGFKSLEILPLDYEEFLVFERGSTPSTNFNHFLKLGTLPLLGYSSKSITLALKRYFDSKFTYQEQSVLIILAIYQTKHLSTHQLYLHSKERFKISKDWFYLKIKEFVSEGIIYFFDDIYQKGGKKMIMFDFTFGRYLAIGQPFITQFDTMVALSLIKHRVLFKTLGIYGYLTEDSELVVSAPFESEESIWKKSYSKFSLYSKYNIKLVTIVTVTNQYRYNIGDIIFEAIPFYEWSILSDEG